MKVIRGFITVILAVLLLVGAAQPCLAAGKNEMELVFENCKTLVTAYFNGAAAIKTDGTLLITQGLLSEEEMEKSAEIDNAVSLGFCGDGLLVLKEDGTIDALGFVDEEICSQVEKWTGIVEIVCENYSSAMGLRYDGTVLYACREPDQDPAFEAISKWKNIVRIYETCGVCIGLKDDGSISYYDPYIEYKEDLQKALDSVKRGTDILVGNNVILIGDTSDPEDCFIYAYHDDSENLYDQGGVYDPDYQYRVAMIREKLAEFKNNDQKLIDINNYYDDVTYLLDDGTMTYTSRFGDAYEALKEWGYTGQELEDEWATYHVNVEDLRNVAAMAVPRGDVDYTQTIALLKDGSLVVRGKSDYFDSFEVEEWKGICLSSANAAKKHEVSINRTYDITTFGSYNGEALEWYVLDVKDGKQFLLSKEGVDCRPMLDDYGKISWKDSDIRTWLNEDFYEEAFTKDEQERISETQVNNKRRKYNYKDTIDNVFLLSVDEAEAYLENSNAIKAEPMDHAYKTAKEEGTADSGWWWLRNNGKDNFYFAGVSQDGVINAGGYNEAQYGYVRPAIWVEME